MVKRNARRRNSKRRFKRNHHPRKQKITFGKLNYLAKKHPITTGVILIIASIVLFRLSFTNVFLSSAEIAFWTWFISAGLFLAGIFVLVGWWRNNISMMTTRHSVNWKNH